MIETVAEPVVSSPPRAARWAASAYAIWFGFVAGHFLLGLPVQVSDSLGDILKLSASWSELLSSYFDQHGFLRPLHWGALKLVHDASGGDYFAWFRGTHVAQVIVLIVLYLALVRPRTWNDAAILPLGLAVLFGLHTFAGTVREAFPINHYLTVLICCFAAAALALGRYRWWNDLLIALLLVVATLTLETGLLVGVVAVGAAMTRAPGISRAGAAAVVVLIAAYFVLRFGVLDVGSPGLLERSSGFGFAILQPSELVERFGANPLLFYAYNIASSALSVLLSEPTAGVFQVARAVAAGSIAPIMVVNVVSSLAASLAIVWFSWTRRRQWRLATFDRDDRLVLLFGLVLAANAIISFPYTKDVIMSPAGAFMAVAVFVAVRHLAAALPMALGRAASIGLVVLAAAIGTTWGFRVLMLHATLRDGAVSERLDWAYIDGNILRGEVQVPDDSRSRSIVRALQDDALIVRPAPPPLDLPLVRVVRGDD